LSALLEGFIAAFYLDRRNLYAHWPQIGRKLTAMMDGMTNRHIQVCDRGISPDADIVHRSSKLFTRQRFQTRCALREVVVIPSSDVSAGLQYRKHRGIVFSEDVVNDSVQEPELGPRNVPGKFE